MPGEDVAVYAWGTSDHLFAGSIEQNVIFQALAWVSDLYADRPSNYCDLGRRHISNG